MLTFGCVSREQSLVHIQPSFPEERQKKIYKKLREYVCVHMCVSVTLCLYGISVNEALRTDSDGSTGMSLKVKLNNNKSAKP